VVEDAETEDPTEELVLTAEVGCVGNTRVEEEELDDAGGEGGRGR